eukprot:scaffold4779_cov116-Isochrysis_galbana.AAC.6
MSFYPPGERVNIDHELVVARFTFDIVMSRGHRENITIHDIERIRTYLRSTWLSESTHGRLSERALVTFTYIFCHPSATDGLNKEKGVGKEWEGRRGATGRH